jgi:hypothetical protein
MTASTGWKKERDWKSNKMKKHVKGFPSVITPPSHPVANLKYDEFGRFLDWLYQWARDMHEWGTYVRHDIVRLEKEVGIPTGDPGDPPEGPPE